MEAKELLTILHTVERLKEVPRHCTTSSGKRVESVAEHSWRLALMAHFLRDTFPEVDMDKVVTMCLIHDLGETFTGDIPTFLKTEADEAEEERQLFSWVASLPAPYAEEMASLYREMLARETPEAKIYKALDGLEAVIQHNESPIETWEDHEYSLNRHYAWERVTFSPELTALRREILKETEAKIAAEAPADKRDLGREALENLPE